MLRIGSDPSDNQVSSINIRQDNERVGVLKNPDGRYSLDVSGSINCNVLLVNGSVFEGGSGSAWTQDDTTGDISYNDGNVFVGTGLDVSGYLKVPFGSSDISSSTYEGYIRYNDVSYEFQGYDVCNNVWGSLGSGTGGGVWTQDASGDISYGDGNVSISGDLHVIGDISGYIHVDQNSFSSTTLVSYSSTSSSLAGVWTQDASDNISYSLGNVGIGTTDPSYALDVSGTINCTELQVSDVAVQASTKSTKLTYQYLRIMRKSDSGVDLVINGLQVWQNDENILSNPNLTDNSLNFYDSSDNSYNQTTEVDNKLENLDLDVSSSSTSIGSYAQLTFPVPPNYDDLQGIYLVSSNSTNYELEGCSIQLLNENYDTVAESEVLGEAANYLMRGPAEIAGATYKYVRFVRSTANAFSSNSGAFEIAGLQVWENDENILATDTTGTIHFYDDGGVVDSSMSFSTLLNDVDSSSNVVSPSTFNSTTGHYGEIEFIDPRSYSSLQAIYTVAPNSTDFPYSGCEIQLLDENKNVIVETGEMARVDINVDDYDFDYSIKITADGNSTDDTGYFMIGNVYAYNGSTNVTLTNPTASSSNSSSFLPEYALNGDHDSYTAGNCWLNGSVNESYPWWKASIPSYIDAILVYARLRDESIYTNAFKMEIVNSNDEVIEDLGYYSITSSAWTEMNTGNISVTSIPFVYPYKANYLFYGPATITAGTGFSPDSSYANTDVGYGVIDSGSGGIGNLVSWSDVSFNVVEDTLTLLTSSTYTNTASKVGALFSSPGVIISWSDFSTYVDDVSLNQNDITMYTNAITIDGGLIVNFGLDVIGDINVDGTAYASGSALTSDDRLKHNEQDISGLELITQLHPQKYLKTRMMYAENYALTEDASGNYTNLKQGDRVDEEMGIIAQDVLNIPELSFCVTDSTPYAVNYNNLFVLSIQAIKELKAEKDALQTTITQLTSRIEALENASTT